IRKRFIFAVFVLVYSFCKSQTLTSDELIYFPHKDPDFISEQLIKKGWEANNIEFITDSNFVRRTWAVKNGYDDLKSYLILYEYTSDTSENHIIYQFSSRQTFNTYKEELKTKG